MRRLSLIIVGVVFSASISHAYNSRTWGGGYMVPLKKYPAVVQIFTEIGRCTATLVGPNVILTAAHCTSEKTPTGFFKIGNTRYNFTFHTYKAALNTEIDLAIGIVDRNVEGVNPVSINFTKNHGNKMIALGFGCSIHTLSENFIKIRNQSDTMYFLNSNDINEDVFACRGDSGGPTLAYDYDLKLQLTGIHLRSDMKSLHMDWKTSSVEFLEFIANVADNKNLKICNYNLECD